VPRRHDQLRSLLAIGLVLVILQLVVSRPLALLVLAGGAAAIFAPLSLADLLLVAIAAAFFLFQNYMSLRSGIFEFRDKDVLLMPWYEPLLWGIYFLSLKRFVAAPARPRLSLKAIAGLAVTSLAFSTTADARMLLVATICSTAILLLMFHSTVDLASAAYMLALGFVIELFGVSRGLWWYPAPDFLGIPFWFATMWVGVGLLGREFLFPLSEWLAKRFAGQRA
jgi:hypothetical protein